MATLKLTHVNRELELDFVREFSVGGQLDNLSVDDRRERIRTAIYAQQLMHEPFRDSGIDYASAYERCYGQRLEKRRAARPEPKPENTDEF
jgi:hypothetical protein